jgi:ADP-heptose:LPS heptosyltransferase
LNTKDNPPGKFKIGIFPFGGSNPGTSMDIKRWDINKYFELIKQLSEKHLDIEIIVFEGNSDNEKIIENDYSQFYKKMTIDIELISKCDLFISGDTGPLYIAEGLNVSTLSIFGPTDPGLYAPRNIYEGMTHEYIWRKPVCSPCYTTFTAIDTKNKKYWKDKTFICYTGTHECLEEVAVNDVFDKVEKILQKHLSL